MTDAPKPCYLCNGTRRVRRKEVFAGGGRVDKQRGYGTLPLYAYGDGERFDHAAEVECPECKA